MYVYFYLLTNIVCFGDMMFREVLFNFLVINLLYEFVEFLFPNKDIRDFVRFAVLTVFLLYFVELILNYI